MEVDGKSRNTAMNSVLAATTHSSLDQDTMQALKANFTASNEKFGCHLVGVIPCSDAFGVDLIIEKFEE